ncbi:MAG TPA: phosphatidylglycerophosphatase A [Bryobacteraceae bacterium]|nr:phosphatidylglycerophosphatase A [Bryobacteraceae bacterium]
MKNKLATLLATCFGAGFAPKAPGTAGSLAGLAIAWLLVHYAHWRPWWFAPLAVAAVLPAMWSAGTTARQRGETDPGVVVVDEVLGQWLALAGARALNVKTWIGAFVLFRLFDIWKPPPARQLERLPGGIGIVADDLMAGIYAALVLLVAGCFNLY